MDSESVCDLLKYPWQQAVMYSHIIHGQFVPTLTFCRSHGRLWLVKHARENAALTSNPVPRLLIIGGACGSTHFIFISQMVGPVLFINALDVQKQQCREMRGLKKLHPTLRNVVLIHRIKNCLFVKDSDMGIRCSIEFGEFSVPREEFQSRASGTEAESGPFFSRKGAVSSSYHRTRGHEPSASRRPTLFCFSGQLV